MGDFAPHLEVDASLGVSHRVHANRYFSYADELYGRGGDEEVHDHGHDWDR